MVAILIPANIAFDNYDGLLAAVHSHLDRDDLAADFPTFVGLAEAMMQRELALNDFETSATVSIIDGVGALPGNFRTIRKVEVDGIPLAQFGVSELAEPGYRIETGLIHVTPAPIDETTATILYVARFSSLSESNPTNSLLDEHPDIYFYGCLSFAEAHLGHPLAAQQYMAMFMATIGQVSAYTNARKWATSPRPRLPEMRV